MPEKNPASYRRDCLLVLFGLLIVWFFASYGCAILGRDWLDANAPPVGNAPFGFWMSQQGSIVVFILILISYRFLMARVDAKHGMVESDSDC